MFVKKKMGQFLMPSNTYNKSHTILALLPLVITLAIFSVPQTAYSASSNTQNSQTTADGKPMNSNSVDLTALTDKQKTTLNAMAKDIELPAEELYKLFRAVKLQFPNEKDIFLFEAMSEAIDEMEMEDIEAEIAKTIEAIEEVIEATEVMEDVTEAIEVMEEVTEAIEVMEETAEAIEVMEEVVEAIEEMEEAVEAIEPK